MQTTTPTQPSLFHYTQSKPPAQPLALAETRHQLQYNGPDHLTAVDLLNLVVAGDAGVIWEHYQSLAALAQAPWQEITNLTGVGEATACRLKAAMELAKRLVAEDQADRPLISSPALAAELVMPEMRDLDQEHLKVLLLDTKNYLMAAPTIYIGNVNSTIVRAAEVFRPAIRVNATGIIIVHNHPSGSTEASPEDLHLTKVLAEAGRMLGVEVLDHMIIGHNRYISLKERGLAF